MKIEDMSEAAKAVANVDWHDEGAGESLCFLIASAYEDDPNKPKDAKPNYEMCGFTDWAIEKTNEICQRIADAAIERREEEKQ